MANNITEFVGGKSRIGGNRQIMKPKFGFLVARTNVNMCKLTSFIGIEEGAKRAPAQNRRPQLLRSATLERFSLVRGGREHGAAGGAQPNPVLDHASGDALDVGDELAAQPHRVRLASLLLLRRTPGLCRGGGGHKAHGPSQAEGRSHACERERRNLFEPGGFHLSTCSFRSMGLSSSTQLR